MTIYEDYLLERSSIKLEQYKNRLEKLLSEMTKENTTKTIIKEQKLITKIEKQHRICNIIIEKYNLDSKEVKALKQSIENLKPLLNIVKSINPETYVFPEKDEYDGPGEVY